MGMSGCQPSRSYRNAGPTPTARRNRLPSRAQRNDAGRGSRHVYRQMNLCDAAGAEHADELAEVALDGFARRKVLEHEQAREEVDGARGEPRQILAIVQNELGAGSSACSVDPPRLRDDRRRDVEPVGVLEMRRERASAGRPRTRSRAQCRA